MLRPSQNGPRRFQDTFLFLHRFQCLFGTMFGRCLVGVRPSLAPNTNKNRLRIDAKMRSHVGFNFWFFLRWFFASNFDPRNLKNQAPAAARARFIKNSFFSFCTDFSSMLMPTCLHFRHFRSKTHQHRYKNRSWKASFFRSLFASFFYRYLFDSGKPTWRHVGHLSSKMG